MPTIPATPAIAGGAGMGSLNHAKINPTINPVSIAKIISFTSSFLLVAYEDSGLVNASEHIIIAKVQHIWRLFRLFLMTGSDFLTTPRLVLY
jgi:hypothetical protein